MSDTIVFVGAYTRPESFVEGKAEGISLYRLDRATGALHHLNTATGLVNPSFLTVSADQRYLYCVQEVGDYAGQSSGIVSAFRLDSQTYELELINQQPTGGAHPCYLSLDPTGKWLFVANYSGGNVSVLPIAEDGALGEPTAVVQHQGQPVQADGPHAHCILAAPGAGNYVLVADCGLDRIYIYRLDTTTGQLQPNEPAWATLQPGSGPRHLAFAPDGRYLYCSNETNSTVSVLSYTNRQDKVVIEEIQTLSTLPPNFTGQNTCADIHIDPTGRYLYVSNRGHDSLAVFAIAADSGKLQPLGQVSTQGRTPRNFGFIPDSDLLLAANQDSDTIIPFRLNSATGQLTATGIINPVPSPSCVYGLVVKG